MYVCMCACVCVCVLCVCVCVCGGGGGGRATRKFIFFCEHACMHAWSLAGVACELACFGMVELACSDVGPFFVDAWLACVVMHGLRWHVSLLALAWSSWHALMLALLCDAWLAWGCM